MFMFFVDFQDLNKKNWNELSAGKINGIGTKSTSNNIDDDDRPLLMWLGGMQGSASNNLSSMFTKLFLPKRRNVYKT